MWVKIRAGVRYAVGRLVVPREIREETLKDKVMVRVRLGTSVRMSYAT